jgi:hypothetical protein
LTVKSANLALEFRGAELRLQGYATKQVETFFGELEYIETQLKVLGITAR